MGVITVAFGSAAFLIFLWKLFILPSGFNYLAAVIGAIGGIGLLIAVVSYFKLIERGARLGVSWTIITLSMIIPTSFSIFLWKEIPTLFQIIGLLFAISSIYLLSQVKSGKVKLIGKEWLLFFMAFFLTGGVGVASKLIPVLGLGEFKITYMAFLYGVPFILAVIKSLMGRNLPGLKEIKIGFGMGIAGVINIFLLLLALESLTGTLAFPLKICGNIIFTNFLVYLIWKERINNKEKIGLGLSLLAIVFMNL